METDVYDLPEMLFSLSFFHLPLRSASPSLQVRCKSVPKNGRKMGLTRELLRTYMGLTWEVVWSSELLDQIA